MLVTWNDPVEVFRVVTSLPAYVQERRYPGTEQ
jgi:hypothetical protein